MPQVTWYWNKGKWIQGHCMYYKELKNLGYLVKRGDVTSPPPKPTEEELTRHESDASLTKKRSSGKNLPSQ